MNILVLVLIILILSYRNKKLSNLDIFIRSLIFLSLLVISRYNYNNNNNKEGFSSNRCYPGHSPMDAQDSIDNPLKYWCEYSGDLPKEDDDSVYDTKEPIYIKDITK